DNLTQFNLTAQARDLLRADDTDLVFYQVRDGNGVLISGDPDFPSPNPELAVSPGEVYLRDDVVRDEDVRVAYTWVPRGLNLDQLVLM
ncbi:sensor histidine kinase N-terminal domain-containing protein, partial [Aquabacterium sp. A08]|uniref:sensor histidine kinase N-terminal domain-containing protein n=1 Tax=Aquabacterium sp. A08 TaxID=2718532 RepID=UPI001AAF3FF5